MRITVSAVAFVDRYVDAGPQLTAGGTQTPVPGTTTRWAARQPVQAAMPASPRPRSPLAMLVEQPMHSYRMQQLIKGRGKHRIANIAQPSSIYQTIDRLLRDGLMAAHATAGDEHRPERTAYAITVVDT